MIYDTRTPDIPPDHPVPPVARRRIPWWLLVLPLVVCMVCAGLALFALLPLTNEVLGPADPRLIPVTGEGTPTAVPTLEAAPETTPDPLELRPSINPQSPEDYRTVVEAQLLLCYGSFADLYMLDTVAAHRPEILESDDWRTRGRVAMDQFVLDCEPLGNLPDPPPFYSEVDFYLKRAVEEIGPASDAFEVALDQDTPRHTGAQSARLALEHLITFVEFAQHAENVMSELDQRKEI